MISFIFLSLGIWKRITYASDTILFPFIKAKICNVATAMLKNFALIKEKITASSCVAYFFPNTLFK